LATSLRAPTSIARTRYRFAGFISTTAEAATHVTPATAW